MPPSPSLLSYRCRSYSPAASGGRDWRNGSPCARSVAAPGTGTNVSRDSRPHAPAHSRVVLALIVSSQQPPSISAHGSTKNLGGGARPGRYHPYGSSGSACSGMKRAACRRLASPPPWLSVSSSP
eukprot:258390-Chlamydomonas_euryale.AAC.1